MATVPAGPHAPAVAELARALRQGRGRRGRAARWRYGRRGRGHVRSGHTEQLASPEVDDPLAAELVGALHRGREWSRAAQLVAERVAGRTGRGSPGRRGRDAGKLGSETSEPRRHLQPARLADAAVRHRHAEGLVPGMIPDHVAGDRTADLRVRGRRHRQRPEQCGGKPKTSPTHGQIHSRKRSNSHAGPTICSSACILCRWSGPGSTISAHQSTTCDARADLCTALLSATSVPEGGGTLVAHVSDLEGSVFLVTGIPAAGKSTVADELARRFGRSVHVRGDVFRRMVVSGRVAMSHSPLPEAWAQLRLRYRLTAMTADTWHDAGFTVVVQDVVVGPVLAEQVAAIRSRPLYLVVLAPSPAAVARREAARTRRATTTDGASRSSTPASVRPRRASVSDRLVGADPRGDRRRDPRAGALGGCGLEHE